MAKSDHHPLRRAELEDRARASAFRESLNRILVLEEDHGECPLSNLAKEWFTRQIQELNYSFNQNPEN